MRNLFYAIILLAMCSLARADVFTINSAQFNDGHYFVGPYHSTLNGEPIISFCVDFTHHVGFGDQFDVTVVSLADFNGPLRLNYLEAAWITQYMSGVTDVFSLSVMQTAIWLITTPGTSDPYLTTSGAFAWAVQAAQNYQSIDASQYFLAIPSGGGQAQLFMVPEPSAAAMFGIMLVLGLSGILFMRLKRRAK